MTRAKSLTPLAIVLLALLAGTPPSAVAAKQQKTAFRIVIEGVARIEQFPTLPPDYEVDFRASGAIKDAGPVGASNNNWTELLGRNATYVVFFDWEAGTFQLWQPADGAWPGTLLGTGAYTYEESSKGWWLRWRAQLDGTVVGE